MPMFDGKSEKFELFEDLFQMSLKIHNQLTEYDRINYFHSFMRGDALQTFKNINGPTRENLREILAVFRRKYVKPQSMATAKLKFQKLVFNPANQNLVDFLDELQKPAKDAFGIAAHAIIEQFIYAKMPRHLKKSKNLAHLENGTYEQIVTHLERELQQLEMRFSIRVNWSTPAQKWRLINWETILIEWIVPGDMAISFYKAFWRATQRQRNECARRGQCSFFGIHIYINSVHICWEGSNVT